MYNRQLKCRVFGIICIPRDTRYFAQCGYMASMSNMFLRNRGRPLNRIGTLQEKAAERLVNQLADGASVGHAEGQMIDMARSKTWARESRLINMYDNSDIDESQYMMIVKQLAAKIARGDGDFKQQVEHMHNLTDPHTYHTYMTENGFPSHYPNEKFTNYETIREREFRLHGRRVDRRFARFVHQVLDTSYSGSRRRILISEVQDKFRISRTAAIAILADLVDKFEARFNRPALLN